MAQVTLTIDDQEVTVEEGMSVIEAAKTIGNEIPHYCYHPGLSVDGNCRMCLVEIEKMPKPMIACNTTVSEGMVVRTQSEKVESMRRSVMEFMLINHPLDCPTCDQAGECRLQDYYMKYDKIPSRFEEEKVHKDKMVSLGSGVMLDQERCIACSRCVRVCQEVAKEDELALVNRGDHTMITTFPGKELSNPYSGNTIDVCPVGALTNKDFRFKKRVWLLKSTESVCMNCSRGCNIWLDHADKEVYRLRPRHNPEVNDYWMCDEGRYGFKYLNENRLLRPITNLHGESKFVSFEESLQKLYEQLKTLDTSSIALVVHASQSQENIQDFIQFGTKSLKTNKLYHVRHEPKDPYSDDILITADKNSNQACVDKLSLKKLSDCESATVALVLGELSDSDFALLTAKNIPVLALWASNNSLTSQKAEIVFPIPSFAEQEGTYININGLSQKTNKAFEPRGEARPVQDSLSVLRHLLEVADLNQSAVS